MALTATEFLASYPEFSTADTDLINEKIARAEFRVSDTWGARRDTIVALRVAADLANSIQGRNARLDRTKSGISIYQEQLEKEQAQFACLLNRVG